jgi:hypothetical protein
MKSLLLFLIACAISFSVAAQIDSGCWKSSENKTYTLIGGTIMREDNFKNDATTVCIEGDSMFVQTWARNGTVIACKKVGVRSYVGPGRSRKETCKIVLFLPDSIAIEIKDDYDYQRKVLMHPIQDTVSISGLIYLNEHPAPRSSR